MSGAGLELRRQLTRTFPRCTALLDLFTGSALAQQLDEGPPS